MINQRSRKPTDERHSESRMRENRTYGSMRGDAARRETNNCGWFNSLHSIAYSTVIRVLRLGQHALASAATASSR